MATPLHEAAMEGHTEAVKLLIDHGADIDIKDDNGRTALHYASLHEHTETIQLLADHSTDVDAKKYASRWLRFIAHRRKAILKSSNCS